MLLVFSAIAWAQAPVALPSARALLELPDVHARVEALRRVVVAPDSRAETIARAAAAVDVVEALHASGRSDPVVVGSFLRAALSEEPALRARALQAARAGEAPPAPPAASIQPLASPEPPPPVDDLEQRLDTYQARRLRTGDRLRALDGAPMFAWTVYQGQQELGTDAFAELVGDDDYLDSLHRHDRRVYETAIASLIGGTVALAASVTMANDDNPDNDGAAMAIGALGGGVGLSLGFSLPMAHAQRRSRVANHYSASEAVALVGDYNETLRAELGLTEADVVAREGRQVD